jgi:acyl-coenzyme A synthetase/AMP-(fatty) acid ligase
MIDVLVEQARRQPNAAMLIRKGEVWTYSEGLRLVLKLAERLALDIPAIASMRLVGISHSDSRWALLASFALEALGLATLSFLHPVEEDFARALGRCDLILSEYPSVQVKRPWFPLTVEWLNQATAGQTDPSFRPAAWRDDALAAVLITSGSSGSVKSVALHRAAFNLREHNRIWQYGFSASSRYLAAMPVTVSLINLVIRAGLRCGASIDLATEDSIICGVSEATHTTLLPLGVRGLLHQLSPSQAPSRPLRCFATGASLSPALRDALIGRLNAQVQDSYGTNETGTVAWIGSNGVADVLPGVEVEVVDENFEVVPKGVPGIVRIRTAELAQGYLEADLNQQAFVDGWFVSSDRGVAVAPRQFRLLGRIDAMLNIGGVKIAPEEVEELLLRHLVADDAAVCTMLDAAGIEQMHVLLAGPRLADDLLVKRLAELLDPHFGDVKVALVAVIPRGHAGKIRREALPKLLPQAIRT